MLDLIEQSTLTKVKVSVGLQEEKVNTRPGSLDNIHKHVENIPMNLKNLEQPTEENVVSIEEQVVENNFDNVEEQKSTTMSLKEVPTIEKTNSIIYLPEEAVITIKEEGYKQINVSGKMLLGMGANHDKLLDMLSASVEKEEGPIFEVNDYAINETDAEKVSYPEIQDVAPIEDENVSVPEVTLENYVPTEEVVEDVAEEVNNVASNYTDQNIAVDNKESVADNQNDEPVVYGESEVSGNKFVIDEADSEMIQARVEDYEQDENVEENQVEDNFEVQENINNDNKNVETSTISALTPEEQAIVDKEQKESIERTQEYFNLLDQVRNLQAKSYVPSDSDENFVVTKEKKAEEYIEEEQSTIDSYEEAMKFQKKILEARFKAKKEEAKKIKEDMEKAAAFAKDVQVENENFIPITQIHKPDEYQKDNIKEHAA